MFVKLGKQLDLREIEPSFSRIHEEMLSTVRERTNREEDRPERRTGHDAGFILRPGIGGQK